MLMCTCDSCVCLSVSLEVIGSIIGSGGAAIKQLSAEPLALGERLRLEALRSGARMSFENEEYQPGMR